MVGREPGDQSARVRGLTVLGLDPDAIRRTALAAIGVGWLAVIGWVTWPDGVPPSETAVVVHWANGHLMGDDTLLPSLAERFNAAGFRTSSGSPIRVDPRLVNSSVIERELLSRAQGKGPLDRQLPDPTLVTPVAQHWLYDINDHAGTSLVATDDAAGLASTWIGIATFRDMAECLGWPAKEIGYEDILALSGDAQGWSSRPCSRAEWGSKPLLTYTDPNSSSTGRTVLFTLYSIAARKLPELLTAEDLSDPGVTAYLRNFQSKVDHYVPDSLLLNCEIFAGPS